MSPCLRNAVNVGEDCPVFDGLFEFCQISASGSIGVWSVHAAAAAARP